MRNRKAVFIVIFGISASIGQFSCGGESRGAGEQIGDSAQQALVADAGPKSPMDQPEVKAAIAFLTFYKENYPKLSEIQSKIKIGRGRYNWGDFQAWIRLMRESETVSADFDTTMNILILNIDYHKNQWPILKTDLVFHSDSIPTAIGDLKDLSLMKSNVAGDNAELEFALGESKIHLLMKKVNGKWLVNNIVF